jgi:hypothetical protein
MTPRFRRVAVFVGAATLAAGVGVGVAATNNDSSADQSISRQQDPAGVGGPRRIDVTALAKSLGFSQTRLEQAMNDTRGSSPSAGGLDSRIQALADDLGLPVNTVREAFDDVFGGPGRPQGTAPATPPAAATA